MYIFVVSKFCFTWHTQVLHREVSLFMNVTIVILAYRWWWIIVILKFLARHYVAKCWVELGWKAVHHIMLDHKRSFGTSSKKACILIANKRLCSISVMSILIKNNIIISWKSFFNLAVEIYNIFELVEYVFIRLFYSALASTKVWYIRILTIYLPIRTRWLIMDIHRVYSTLLLN